MFDKQYAIFTSTSSIYPENRNNDFRCKSPMALKFPGDFLVALHSISYPRSFSKMIHLNDAYIEVDFNKDEKTIEDATVDVKVYLEKGNFSDENELSNYLNDQWKDALDTYLHNITKKLEQAADFDKKILAQIEQKTAAAARLKRQTVIATGEHVEATLNLTPAERIAAVQEELEDVKRKLSKAMYEGEILELKINDKDRQLAKAATDKEGFINAMSDLNAESTKLTQDIKKLNTQVDGLTKDLETARTELSEANKLGVDEKAKKEAAEENVTNITKTLDATKESLRAAQSSANWRRRKQEEAEEAKQKIENALADLTTQKNTLDLDKANVDAELAKQLNEVKRLEGKVSSIEQAHKAAIQQLNAEAERKLDQVTKEKDTEIDKLTSQLGELQITLSTDKTKAKEQADTAQATIIDLQNRLAAVGERTVQETLYAEGRHIDATLNPGFFGSGLDDEFPGINHVHTEFKREVRFGPEKPLESIQAHYAFLNDPNKRLPIIKPYAVKDGLIQMPYYMYVKVRNDIVMLGKIHQYLKDADLKFAVDGKRLFVTFNPKVVHRVRLSEELGEITGFGSGSLITNHVAKYLPDILAGIHGFAVYETSGLLQETIFGEKMAPILRYVTLGGEEGKVHEENYPNPTWIPVQARNIEDLHFELRTLFGTPMPFEWGGIVLTLIFKRAIGA